ncbi:MAG: hypothetical protein MJK04_22275, partial [Psychrosphaera sp.]|nr:hypothetical protein [Psychrosphaera sp.]
ALAFTQSGTIKVLVAIIMVIAIILMLIQSFAYNTNDPYQFVQALSATILIQIIFVDLFAAIYALLHIALY